MTSTIYVYCVSPIDDFHLWTEAVQYLNQKVTKDFFSTSEFNEFNEVFGIGKMAARLLGWEGDIREGPFVSMLPSYDSGSNSPFIIAWKQDNNGTCFIVSPYLLPWIEVSTGSPMVRCNVVRKPEEWQLLMKLVKFEP